MDSREGTIDAGGGVRLFYRSAGSGPETVIVIHGGPGFSMGCIVDDMLPLAREHRVVFYDPRGTGRSTLVSDATALDALRSVDDLEALRQHFGLPRLTLLGHSWGAGVAALYAARHPERVQRLIVVGGIPLRRSELTETFRNIAAGRGEAERTQLKQASEAWIADAGSATACRAFYDLWYRPFYGDPAARGRSQGDFCAGSRRRCATRSKRSIASRCSRWATMTGGRRCASSKRPLSWCTAPWTLSPWQRA